MYSKISLDDVEKMEVPIEGNEGEVRPVGYGLDVEKMRPNVWYYDEGESNSRHKQTEQEEMYFVLEGSAVIEVDGEEVDMDEGDFVVVPPEPWRQVTAKEESVILAVGSPNVVDDHVVEGEGEE